MNVEAWSAGEEDPGRIKRLAVGYAVGAAILAISVAVGATVKSAVKPAEEDDVIDVKLVETATAAPPAPPPPPPPPPPIDTPKPAQAGPAPRKAIMAPKAVPTEAPPESDKPKVADNDDDPYADGKGGSKDGIYGGSGVGPANAAPAATTAAAPPPPPPPPPAPKAAGPINLPENGTPPVALANAPPPYPEDARRSGVEAVVVVRFVVSETGEVTGVTIVRGHPMFDAAVLAAVRSWRYQPALVDGRPVPVYRTARIPFKLKT